MPLCDALALKPPCTENLSLRSTVSGTSIPISWPDGNDRPGETGKFGSADRDRNVASAEVREGLLNPIESVFAGRRNR
jgi:hypothetical protein